MRAGPATRAVLAALLALASGCGRAELVEATAAAVIEVAPDRGQVQAGATLQFTARVAGLADTSVDWSVEEGAAGGTVTAAGLYTAPAAAGTFHVVARSRAADRAASAAVTVTPAPPEVAVSLSPGEAALLAGRSVQFEATVTGTGDGAVWWWVREGSAGGEVTSNGRYTAPEAAGTFHVVATSRADPARWAEAAVTVRLVEVTVSPPEATLLAGRTLAFTAAVTGAPGPGGAAVDWSVQEGAAGGTVGADGRYTAPADAGTFHVVATSRADPRRAAVAAVTVQRVAISVSPAAATLLDGATLPLTAAVTGVEDTAADWSVQEGSAGGAVTADGRYTAPGAAGTFHVVATSRADPACAAAAVVTVQRVAVSVSPASAALAAGQARRLAATVSGTPDGAVDWSVQEGPAGGAVDADGLYAAPWTAGTYHVVATSRADPRRAAVATVAVSAAEVSVTLSPGAATLFAGDTLRFTAAVAGSPDGAVAWSIPEGVGCGAVADGHYTAPDAPGTCHVVATSLVDPTRSAVAEVTVAPAGPASLWEARLGIGVVDGGPLAGTWDLDPRGHPDTLIVVQTPNAGSGVRRALEVFFGPVGGPMALATLPVDEPSGVGQVTALMDTSAYRLHALAPAGNLFSLVYLRAAVLRGADGRITGFAKEAEVAFAPFEGNAYGDALAEVVDGQGHHRLAGVVAVDDWYGSGSRVLGFVTSVAGGVAPTAAAQFTGFGGGAALDTLAAFQHTGGPGALDGAYGCMSSVVQQPTSGTIYAFSALGLHGESTAFHRIFAIPLAAPGAAAWGPAVATNYSDTGTGSNFAVALPSGHVYWSWEDGTDSRLGRIAPDGTLNLAPLPALGFRAEFDPGACHVAVQGDRVMTILHEWGPRARVSLATGVDHDAAGTAATPWSVTELTDPVTGQYPLIATGVGGLGRAGGHFWTAMLSAHYSSVHVESWLVVAPFP